MIKYTQTIRQQLPTKCLSVLDHFVWLASHTTAPNTTHILTSFHSPKSDLAHINDKIIFLTNISLTVATD